MRWDLKPLFKSREEALKLLEELENRTRQFTETHRGRLATYSPHHFRRVLEEYEELLEGIGRVEVYSFLLFAEDSNNGPFLAEVEEKATKVENNLLWFELEFLELPEERRRQFIADSGRYRYLLERWVAEKPYRLGEREEQILTQKNLTSFSAFTRLFDEELGRLRVQWDQQEIGEEELLAKLYSPDREVRKRAQVLFTIELEKRLPLLTFIYNRIKQDWKLTYCEIRGYPDPEAPRHLSNQVSRKSVDSLVEVVNRNFEIVADYYRVKKELLGLEELFDFDRYAPLKMEERKVSFEEGMEIVLRSFRNFSPVFEEIAVKAFTEGWIDLYPRERKRGGAFSCSTVTSAHPYLLLNYTETNRDLFTLAHELGHTIHQYLSQQAGYLNQHTPLTTAETASIFAEMVLFEELKQELPPDQLLPLYASKIEDIFATLFRQIVFTNFERRVFEAPGELSSDQLSEIWFQENQ
ncbi:MAG: M3 family metallopeptidase, partial [Campylobacterales bacterium]